MAEARDLGGSDTEDSEEFYFVDRELAQKAELEAWPAGRREGRLSGLLRPWARRRGLTLAPAGTAPAPRAATQLAEIPILSMSAPRSSADRTFLNPLNVHPLGPSLANSPLPQPEPLLLFGVGPSNDPPEPGRELGQDPSPWLQDVLPAGASTPLLPPPMLPPSPTAMAEPLAVFATSVAPVDAADSGQGDASSLCSGISTCSSEDIEMTQASHTTCSGLGRGSRDSSFSFLQQPSPVALSSSSSSGGSRHSSSSDLVNQLMLQAEPAAGEGTGPAPLYPLLPPAEPPAAAPGRPAGLLPQFLPPPPAAAAPPATSAPAGVCVPNPLLQQEQAALLSWRRHALQHAARRESDLLRRLLSHPGEEIEDGLGWTGPLSPASATVPPPASSSVGGSGSRGRATLKHLLALIALLALAVLLLHVLHSNALHQQMADEQAEDVMQTKAQAQLRHEFEVRATMLGRKAEVYGDHSGLSGIGGMRHGALWQASPFHGRLPRLHLRRRLTLLLFAPRPARGGQGPALQRSSHDTGGFVYEEWEVVR